jgi:glycine oxidase
VTSTADAVVVGGGLIGLACAAAIARHGGSSIVLDPKVLGSASAAAAGMLAPSVERSEGRAHTFAIAARDRYPTYVDELAEAVGIEVPLNRAGILQVALSENGTRGLRRTMPPSARWIDGDELRLTEPVLAHALGAVHHPRDGAVDNVVLLAALTRLCRSASRIRWHDSAAVGLMFGPSAVSVRSADGETHGAGRVVLAAGAWSTLIEGLPRRLPVTPLRGQMLAYEAVPLVHVVFGPRGYVVPRQAHSTAAAETLVGATSESVGFDAGTTASAARSLHSAGSETLRVLSAARPLRHWAGLRPMTPDLLPILGPDPEEPRLLYACGHSRNGVLMAPLTGDCIAALVLDAGLQYDLSAFRVDRF